jgi:hypothetical protein
MGKAGGGLESLTGGKGNIFTNILKGTPGINPSAGGGLPDLLGRAKEFILPGADKKGLFKNVLGGIGSFLGGMGAGQQDEYTPIMDQNGNVIGYRNENTMQDISIDQYNQMMGQQGSFFGRETPRFLKGIEDTLKGQTDPRSASLFKGIGAIPGKIGEAVGAFPGGGFGLGATALLAKAVYDDAKEREGGLSLTPQVTMDALGRYQLASDLGTGGTRGEFGLAPKPAVLDIANMGQRQAFAVGGVAELDLREGGESIGPGTGTSDDIPAMLSDGEFVMTAAATRGAGAFNMKKNKSGIELIKGGKPSREDGVKNMRQLMNIFEGM